MVLAEASTDLAELVFKSHGLKFSKILATPFRCIFGHFTGVYDLHSRSDTGDGHIEYLSADAADLLISGDALRLLRKQG